MAQLPDASFDNDAELIQQRQVRRIIGLRAYRLVEVLHGPGVSWSVDRTDQPNKVYVLYGNNQLVFPIEDIEQLGYEVDDGGLTSSSYDRGYVTGAPGETLFDDIVAVDDYISSTANQ